MWVEQRPLGKTGATVSALGFGCGTAGGLMNRGKPCEQRAVVERDRGRSRSGLGVINIQPLSAGGLLEQAHPLHARDFTPGRLLSTGARRRTWRRPTRDHAPMDI